MPGFSVETTGTPWPVLIVPGTAAFVTGVSLLLFPLQSLRFMLTLAGILALAAGILLLATAARLAQNGTGSFLAPLIPGTCAVVFAAVIFLNPDLVLAFAALIFGLLLLAGGVIAAGTGIMKPGATSHRALTLIAGCLFAALGLLVLLHPAGAAEITIRVAGLLMALAGIVLLAMGIRGRVARDPLEYPEYRVIEEK